jgi:hypothetical protein
LDFSIPIQNQWRSGQKKKESLMSEQSRGSNCCCQQLGFRGRGGGDGGEVGSVAVMSSDGLVLTVFQWSKLGFEGFVATGHSGGMGGMRGD